MRLNILLAFLGAFVAAVQAQSPLAALAKHMPKCSVGFHYHQMADIDRVSDLSV
jgi:hypothetical protein